MLEVNQNNISTQMGLSFTRVPRSKKNPSRFRLDLKNGKLMTVKDKNGRKLEVRCFTYFLNHRASMHLPLCYHNKRKFTKFVNKPNPFSNGTSRPDSPKKLANSSELTAFLALDKTIKVSSKVLRDEKFPSEERPRKVDPNFVREVANELKNVFRQADLRELEEKRLQELENAEVDEDGPPKNKRMKLKNNTKQALITEFFKNLGNKP